MKNNGKVVCLIADMLAIPVRMTGDLLIAEGSHKITVAGMPVSLPYEMISSWRFSADTVAVVLSIGGEESSMAILLCARAEAGGAERGRLFILDTRTCESTLGLTDWLEQEKFATQEDLFKSLRDKPEGLVKKNYIWSQGEGHWRSAPKPVAKVETAAA